MLTTGRVRVRAPATSANLGPGFDSFGLALDWVDEATVRLMPGDHHAVTTGEGAGELPTDADHLIIACLLDGLADLGVTLGDGVGALLEVHNTIPQARGLGSSSAAIVTGLTAAWGLARPDEPLDRSWALRHAVRIEGHPDNVAAAVYGGFTIAYPVEGGAYQVLATPVHADLRAAVIVPPTAMSTQAARGVLPDTVAHADAARNSAAAALLVVALTRDPGLLVPATQDWLHTRYRGSVMPAAVELIGRLRAAGFAAVMSGAGPTVLVLGTDAELARLADWWTSAGVAGFAVERRGFGTGAGIVGAVRRAS